MSNNSDTIAKLSEALNTLIIAYEELQNENNGLKTDIKTLQGEKEDLKNRLEDFENTTQQQNSNISNMLGKIESLLGNSKNKVNTITNKPNENTTTTPSLLDGTQNNDKKDEKESGETKIDLNRMASLLNGLGR